ncbi:MAG: hypothetical protein LWW96_18940 [Acidovorax sp.]|uniref:hypothetical protein n=1 Tax=Acidovorax sp. TaxID=1872122 RepID=UPI0025BA1E16|nr:hypothetical protein [Acidovorax sp.]MCE1194226.1 hypothetical protein [Acidovorax sp.]
MPQKNNAHPAEAKVSAIQNGVDSPTITAESKAFATLQARFALCGHALHRVNNPNGTQTFWAERWGLVRYLPSLQDATLFLARIGGRV